MWGGDRSRKTALIEYGFRLPSALDNRPLTFNEFESMYRQAVYVSATPSDYELEQAGGVVVEQIIRPTGLLDPEIDIRPSINQIDDLLDEVDERVKQGDRVLVTTLTKRMAEELSKYMDRLGIKVEYVHSDVKTLDRVEILRKLRLGEIDVLIGVNLLREGLDLPEVSLVAILDADKEGFLRDQRSLIQTMGRAARNDKGKVIMYADRITGSMQRAIDETNRRRATQLAYNEKHGITPRTVRKNHAEIMGQTTLSDYRVVEPQAYAGPDSDGSALALAAEPVVAMMNRPELEKLIKTTEKQMEAAAKDLDFLTAAKLRDELAALKVMLKSKRE
jgi:excinuclease ABC subunit B